MQLSQISSLSHFANDDVRKFRHPTDVPVIPEAHDRRAFKEKFQLLLITVYA